MTGAGAVEPPVLLERDRPIGVVRLNRPTRGNAWNDDLDVAYHRAMRELDDDPACRCIVVTGAGEHFCVGGDMDVLEEISAAHHLDPRAAGREPHLGTTCLRTPVVAAVNGAAAGAGLVQALSCDVRLAGASARFTTAYARRGLAAESGIAWLLPRLVGTGHAMDLLLSGRTVGADEAARIGLVNRVVPDDDLEREARAYALVLASWCSPTSTAAIKAQVWSALDETMDETITSSDAAAARLGSGPDLAEGIASFLERRQPHFDDVRG